MRIGIDGSIFRFPKAGIARYLKNVLINLINLSPQDLFLLYSPTEIILPKEIANINLRIGKNFTKKLGSFWFQLEGEKFFFQDKINIFWGQNHILPFKLAKRIPTLVTVHDLSFYYFPHTLPFRSWLIVRSLFWKTIRYVTHIITPSNFVKRSLISFGISPSKITAIPEGVDKIFRPLDKQLAKTKIKEKYQIEKDFILSVGTIEPRKNYPLLIKAFENFQKDFLLVIIGQKGWKNQRIFQMVKKLNLENKIIFLFSIDDEDLCYFYNAATLFIYPSLYEGFGLPVLEALNCGVPTITSFSSSLPEVGGDAVLYFNPYDEKDLANQIKKLLSSHSLQKELREKGLIRAKLFSFKKTAQQILDLMYALIKNKLP
ncbi:MAG: glycosyltransferase family 1 protein [candidate division WOR-3 bacterium]